MSASSDRGLQDSMNDVAFLDVVYVYLHAVYFQACGGGG